MAGKFPPLVAPPLLYLGFQNLALEMRILIVAIMMAYMLSFHHVKANHPRYQCAGFCVHKC